MRMIGVGGGNRRLGSGLEISGYINLLSQAEQKKRKIWKLVLTGGPCGGKTTGQARLSTFFENLGWKVYRYMYLVNKYV